MKTIDLSNLAEFSEQEVFDYVVSNLLKQNKKSMILSACVYKHPEENLKCAAGFLIADHQYDANIFEECTWEDLVKEKVVPEDHCNLIRSLQLVHDNYGPEDWVRKLKNTAQEYQLQWNF